MRNLFKDFCFFSQSEKRGIILLLTIIGIVFLGGHYISIWKSNTPISSSEQADQKAALQEYKNFKTSLQDEKSSWRKRHSFHTWKEKENIPIVLTPFNPNHTDSATFRHLGLPAWMAKNILRYRRKGGKFRKPEDFRKVYGLTAEQYTLLSPYIYISPEDTARNIPHLYLGTGDNTVEAKGAAPVAFKYPTGTVIDLNRADTTELKKIPGIGSGIARLIVGYRQRLGGFYCIEQLKDIHLDTSQVQDWFSLEAEDIRRINLNRVSVDRLRSHPYFNFYQAKVIVEYRKKKGALNSLKPLALYDEFTKNDLERISHYICFK